MCGGFTITADKKKIIKRFQNVKFDGSFNPRFNARPFQMLPIITQERRGEVILAKWEFAMPWDEKKKVINIRSESLNKSFYRNNYANNRCLVLADGFYEWEKVNGKKLPHKYTVLGEDIFSMAGLYQIRDAAIHFAIITVSANVVVGKIHDRMPVILNPDQEQSWLNGEAIELIPFSGKMGDEVVTAKVNSSGFDEPY